MSEFSKISSVVAEAFLKRGRSKKASDHEKLQQILESEDGRLVTEILSSLQNLDASLRFEDGDFYITDKKAALKTVDYRMKSSSVRKVLAEEKHEEQIALMKFLSSVADKYNAGEDIYVVGGAPRDFVIDRPIKDIDVVIDKVSLGEGSEWFAKTLKDEIPVQSTYTTNQYGVAILTINESWDLDGHDLQGEVIEIANARKESYKGDGGKGYKPTDVEPATIEEDIDRREFTMNTLLWQLADLASGPDKEDIIDLTGCGLKDLEESVMRCPSDADKTFSDDPTRMLRAVKYLIRYGFGIHPVAEKSIRNNSHKLKKAPPNAVAEILIGDILAAQQSRKTLEALDDLGLLDVIKEIMRDSDSFKTTLSNWATRDAEVLFMFELMDVGLPINTRIDFLSKKNQARLHEIALGMDPKQAKSFVDILKQPGKVLNTKKLIDKFGLSGREIGQLMEHAKRALLENPSLSNSSRQLTKAVKERFR